MKKQAALCMIMAVVSFMGFVVENVWLAITKGYIDNRNMEFPFLMGYGMAIIAIYFMFGTPGKMVLFGKELALDKCRKKMLYFLVVMLCVSVGEIALGTFVEHTCHVYWWDYSNVPFHITRYTSIPTSILFSGMIVIFMEYVFTPLYAFFLSWDSRILYPMAVVLLIIMLGDLLGAGYRMYKGKRVIRKLRFRPASALVGTVSTLAQEFLFG